MRGTERVEESLCEKSMKVVTNVIRLSAFSIAKRSLGTNGDQVASSRTFQPTSETINIVSTKPLLRAQRPQTNPNQTYLVEPESVIGSSYIVKEDMNVDGRASDYIRKVREKNQKDLFAISETSSYNELARTRVVK